MNQTTDSSPKSGIREFEFIALMAFLMSNVALSIDAILPALPEIGLALEVTDSSQLQLVVVMIFLGLGLGELVFGTLSDSFGRKPIVYIGVGVFTIASLVVVFAPSLEIFLIGRVFQGIGLSAARSVSIAIIRDTYDGDRMARIMSFIMTIFILVPMIAPMLGQLILEYYNWQTIFYLQLLFIGITIVWFTLRQRETLAKEKKIPISKSLFINGVKEFFRHKQSVIYTFISGIIQGSFIAYLSSSQQIFQVQYGMVEEFPLIFGGLAFSFGMASLLNGFLVVKYGMLKLVNSSLYIFVGCSLTYILIFGTASNPSLTTLLSFLFFQFLSLGFIFGNLSSLTMQPIGHIAGVGAATYSFISILVAVTIAIFVGQFIKTTVVPMFIGFFIAGVISFILIRIVKIREKVNVPK
ncbi:MAG: DHA1 family bicyclomycin/chloramphenicol resistance-like MFS transporter [Cognaticolwellia sp.]|jgi:DHA1 family bicyclomycin/chloramphenicol resistance-like MFS transporter